jgi:hypothetical protein
MPSQKLENDIKELKSKASLFDHCSIIVLSLSHHCLITVFFKWSCVTKHSPVSSLFDPFFLNGLVSPNTAQGIAKELKMIKKGYNMIDNMTSNALQNDVI